MAYATLEQLQAERAAANGEPQYAPVETSVGESQAALYAMVEKQDGQGASPVAYATLEQLQVERAAANGDPQYSLVDTSARVMALYSEMPNEAPALRVAAVARSATDGWDL